MKLPDLREIVSLILRGYGVLPSLYYVDVDFSFAEHHDQIESFSLHYVDIKVCSNTPPIDVDGTL